MFLRWLELRRRIALAKSEQGVGQLYDPIEDDVKFAQAFAEADRLTELELQEAKRGRGFCHRYWHTKKRILKKQFGIQWFSPVDMNWGIMFD